MEDRKRRFDEATDVRTKIADVMKTVTKGVTFLDGVHVFTAHGDIPDDASLRLVILPLENPHAKEEPRMAADAVLEVVRSNGTKPRYRGNRLLFVAADHGTIPRLKEATRVALAWGSIVDDVKDGRLNVDMLQKKQAEKELQGAEDALPRVARECYRWLLVPTQSSPTDRTVTVEAFPLNTGGGSLGAEIERTCTENELVISTWSPIHLRAKLRELYWKPDRPAAEAMAFWEDTLKYVYLPRLKSRRVVESAITNGAVTEDFFGVAYGRKGDGYEGFRLGTASVQFDDTLLLIEPEAARAYEQATRPAALPNPNPAPPPVGATPALPPIGPGPTPPPPAKLVRTFHGTAEINAATAKMKLVQLAEEIIAALCNDPNADVKVTVEISADFPYGASDQLRRVVSENAKSLYLKNSEWD
jgi:hypothetical protein